MANKKFNSWIKNICMGWASSWLNSLLASCNDLMHDDLPPCDMGVDLQFKYDYNVQRADMFKDHVGGLSVFVYDEQGNFIARHDAYNDATSQPLKDPNYAMPINLEQANTASPPSPSKRNTKMHSRSQVPNSR